MVTIRIREGDLRAAMRDRRYWQPGHPERADHADWVTEAWQRLYGDDATIEDGERVVQVQAHDRVRNGRREQVDAYTQRRRGARGRDAGAAERQRLRQTAPEPAGEPRQAPSRPALIIFVGGLYDSLERPVGKVFDRARREASTNTTVEFAAHDETARIRSLIDAAPSGTRIVLVGHSWGADTAAQLVDRLGREGRPIDTLVTIDPVGSGLSQDFFRRVRAGAQEWINVNAAGGSPTEASNLIARVGGQYGRRPEGIASQHIDTPFTHGDFTAMVTQVLPDGRRSLFDRILGR